MCRLITNTLVPIIGVYLIIVQVSSAAQLNRTSTSPRHARRGDAENHYFKERPAAEAAAPARRAQTAARAHYKNYAVSEDNAEDYITSYEADYGAVTSNFTAAAYDNDDNPLVYPNPETVAHRESALSHRAADEFKPEVPADVELPADSLADADLKEHNLIDSITYLYGYTSTAGRTDWILLVYVSRALACILVIGTAVWVLWSEAAREFRAASELYPVNVNLLCCLGVCNLIYMEAILGASTTSRCEVVALLLHYAHLVCAVWLLALCWSVTDYCVRGSVPPLKYNYLFAYGVPAVMVLFNYALSMERYETKHYCWMSVEKGMLFGFMLPGTVLIVVTTALVLLGLRSLNRRQSEILATKIQELIDQQLYSKSERAEEHESPKNTDSSDTLDREYNTDEECGYGHAGSPTERAAAAERASSDITDEFLKLQSIKFGLMNMSIDNLSWKSASYSEVRELKSYLNFCLVMQPLYAVVWVMGVVALENSDHWLTPSIFLVLCTGMYVYLAVQMCTTLPTLQTPAEDAASCCEEFTSEPSLPRSRTTDSIPLLDSTTHAAGAAPGDTISTISI